MGDWHSQRPEGRSLTLQSRLSLSQAAGFPVCEHVSQASIVQRSQSKA